MKTEEIYKKCLKKYKLIKNFNMFYIYNTKIGYIKYKLVDFISLEKHEDNIKNMYDIENSKNFLCWCFGNPEKLYNKIILMSNSLDIEQNERYKFGYILNYRVDDIEFKKQFKSLFLDLTLPTEYNIKIMDKIEENDYFMSWREPYRVKKSNTKLIGRCEN